MSNDDTGWSSFAKAAALVFGVLLIIAIFGAIIGVSWWRKSGRNLIRDGQVAMEQGHEDGLHTDEDGCLQNAVEGARKNRGVGFMVQANLRLRGCLVTSKTNPAFCNGVPKATAFVDSARWQTEKCAAEKMEGASCAILGAIQEYCYSRDRRSKIAP